jgi:hypothetical protein
VLVPCKEHCLMGMRGSVRRSSDGHLIHANVDTDIIVAEEPPFGSCAKPEELYHIIEHFAQGRRRLELFGEDHNIRPGWLTLGASLSGSSFDAAAYAEQFGGAAAQGEWLGPGGNPQPGAPWLLGSTPEIEELRPRSPLRGGGHGGNSGPWAARGGRGGGGHAPGMGGPGRGMQQQQQQQLQQPQQPPQQYGMRAPPSAEEDAWGGDHDRGLASSGGGDEIQLL